MGSKIHSWKSYLFLTVSVFTTTLMLLLDPIASAITERLSGTVIYIIIFGGVFSILLAVVAFSAKYEKKVIPSIAVIFTLINTGVIIFFLWFGSRFV